MRSGFRTSLGVVIVWAVLGGSHRPASAELTLGLDIDGGFPVGDSSEVTDPGFGVGLRFGWLFADLGPLFVRPEIVFAYNTFNIPGSQESFTDMLRVLGGVRLGSMNQWVPYVYGHIGYGNFALDFAEADFSDTAGGFAWDAGLAWDPLGGEDWRLGLHVTYVSTRFRAESRFQFVAFGIHGDMLL